MSIRYTANTGAPQECAVIFKTVQEVRDAIRDDPDAEFKTKKGFICRVTNSDGIEYDALTKREVYYLAKRAKVEIIEKISRRG